MRATVNSRNNLAHCFSCKKNLNNIDLLITLDYDFCATVTILQRWLNQYEAHQTNKKTPLPPPRKEMHALSCKLCHASPIPMLGNTAGDPANPVAPSFSRIRKNSGNRPSPGRIPYSVNLGQHAIRIWFGTRPVRANPQHFQRLAVVQFPCDRTTGE
jgi:hypothetical protein